MKDGQIAAYGTPDEIMKPEILTNIFETKIEVINRLGSVAIY